MTPNWQSTTDGERRVPPPPPPRGVTLLSASLRTPPSSSSSTTSSCPGIGLHAADQQLHVFSGKAKSELGRATEMISADYHKRQQQQPRHVQQFVSVNDDRADSNKRATYLETRYAYSVNGILGSAAQASAAAAFFAR